MMMRPYSAPSGDSVSFGGTNSAFGRAPLFVFALVFAACGSLMSACGNQDAKDPRTETAAAFCEEHQIAEAQCVFCDPSLVESLGFCNGHGVAEAYCYQCNAALIPAFKAVGDWCAGHDRPESQCYICNPHLDPANKEPNDGASPTSETLGRSDREELDLARSFAPSTVPRRQRPPTVTCTKQNLIVRFDDPSIARAAGLEIAPVQQRPISKVVECNAEVVYDENRYAVVSAQLSGVAAEVHKDLGAMVRKGEPLVTITSAPLGAAQAAYLQALAGVTLWERNHARETRLLESGVSTETDFLEAETGLAEARIQASQTRQILLSLGLSEREIETIATEGETRGRYVLRAPFDGSVVDRSITMGEVVEPSVPLFSVADVTHIWGFLDLYESDLAEIRTGNPVILEVEALPGRAFPGFVTWISSALDPRTRTLRARAEFDNADGLLRANMFAQASVVVRNQVSALVVPTASVQWEGCCNVVFVKKTDSTYEPRKVHLGVATGSVYEILEGLSEGEEVVTTGSFLLKTEILKGSIGAGCCEVDPGA